MDIDTTYLDSGTDQIKLARPALLAMAQRINAMYAEAVDVRSYGAIGDGLPHPLSERYATLALARAVYPHANALSDSFDWCAIQAAINTGYKVRLGKPLVKYCLNRELLFTLGGQRMYGDGPGSGLEPKNYTPYCGLEWFGTGARYLMTRRVNRQSVSDPTDAPMSACISVQAEGVHFAGFSVLLNTPNYTVATEYGAEWDVGVFVGCRINFTTEDVHIIAYNRVANLYMDVTRAAALPELPHPTGVVYARGAVLSGADGSTHHRIICSGGRWAEVRLGALRNDNGLHFNELAGTLSSDGRGGSGCSDFVVYNGNFRGGVHHNNKRWADPVAVPLTGAANEGFAGGASYVDAYAGIAAERITKQTYHCCRFLSEEVFVCRLDHVGNIRYDNCHWEFGNRAVVPAAGGAQVDPSDFTNYGYGTVATTTRTGTVVLLAPSTNLPTETWFWNVAGTIGERNKILLGSDYGEVRVSGGPGVRLDGTAGLYISGSGVLDWGDSARFDNMDLNLMTSAGMYWCGTPTANSPLGVAAVFLRVTRFSSASIVQELIQYGGSGDTDTMYYRRCVSGVWHTWKRVMASTDRCVQVLASTAVPVAGSAVTTEEVYATIVIPANSMGPNGKLRINLLWTSSTGGGSKGVGIRLGGIGGVQFLANNLTTTNSSTTVQNEIQNRGSAASQVGRGLTLTVYGGTANAVVTSTVDTTVDQTLVITGTKSVAADTLKLESYTVELLP